MTTPDATYVFCLVQSARALSTRGVPDSVPGAGPPRLIPVDRDIWAVVADAPLDRFDAEQLQNEFQEVEAISRHALAHASVIEFFFRRAPVIPLKLFTLFSSDDRLREYLKGRSARLRKLFRQLRGLEEWGVRIIAGEVEADSARTLASGREYLEVKKRLIQQNAAPPRSTVKAAGAALRALGALAAKVRKEAFPPPGKGRPFVTGASFLVKASRRAQWKRQVARRAAALAKQGHRLEATGPWPPYHFVSR
jgi:Gas vesicle synthesis protein GvpL/GvpF